MTETTWYRWKNQYGAMLANDAKKLKELEKENSRLKTIVADLTLDVSMLKELSPRSEAWGSTRWLIFWQFAAMRLKNSTDYGCSNVIRIQLVV